MTEVSHCNSFRDVRGFSCDWKIYLDKLCRAFKAFGKVESSPLIIPGTNGLECYLVCTKVNSPVGGKVTRVQVNQTMVTMAEAELFTVSLQFKNEKVVKLAGDVDVLCDDIWLKGKFGDNSTGLFDSSIAIFGTRRLNGWQFNPLQSINVWSQDNRQATLAAFWVSKEATKPLHIKMKVFSPGEMTRNLPTTAMANETSGSELQNCMKRVVLDPKFSDITLQCKGGTKFKCHKVILGACSPVLSNMFDNDMKESNTGLLEIEDFEPEVVEAMIEYIYTNEVTKTVRDLDRLLYIADKYDLPGLVKYCYREFSARLDDGQLVANMLIAGDKLNKEEFKKLAMGNILIEKSKFTSDEDFVMKLKDNPNPELLMEVFRSLGQ